MTVVPHAEKARSTAESVVRVSKEGQLDQELLQQVADAIKEASLKGQMNCTLKYEKWEAGIDEKVQDIETYLAFGMGYKCNRHIDTNGTLVLEVNW